MDPSADTLDIKPMTPAGASSNVSPAEPNTELEAIRARIAAIGGTVSERAGEFLPPDQTVNLRPEAAASPQTAPLPQPISPAAQAPAVQPRPQAKSQRALPSPVKPILSAIGAFVFLLVIFKSQIIFSQLRYLTGKPAAITSSAPATAIISADPTITIAKINVSAPVVYEPSTQEAAIMKGLESGVVHYGTTPVPGQAGNMVIVGHSSNDWWEPGNYKFVFVLLDKLVVGDKFSINYQSHRYVYEVTNTKVVAPTDLSVLAPTPGPTATLITCTPPGTSWKRLVIQAKQISPAPGPSAASVDQTLASDHPAQLPGNAPSFTDQIGQAWSNIVRGLSGLFGHNQAASSRTDNSAPAASAGNPQTLPGN